MSRGRQVRNAGPAALEVERGGQGREEAGKQQAEQKEQTWGKGGAQGAQVDHRRQVQG